jgi:O-antigen/teichoic acid export membrane protein
VITFKKLDLFLTYSSTALVMVASLLTMMLINMELGLESYGKFTFILAITGFLSMLFSLRSGEAVVKFLSDHKISKNHLLSSALIFDFIVFSLNILVLFVGAFIYFVLYKAGDTADFYLILLLGLSSGMQIISGVPNGVLLFKEEFKILSLMRIIMPLLRITLLLFFYFFTKFTLELVCFSYFISTFISIITNWFIFFKKYSFVFAIPGKDALKEYFNIASIMYTSLFFKSTLMNADTIILGLVTSTEKLGVYQTIKLLLQPMNLLANPLGKIIYPKISKAAAVNNIQVIVKSICMYSLILSSVGVFVIAFTVIFHNIFSYFTQVNVLEYYGFLILFSVQILSLCIGDWWFRSFSNSTNPKYSLFSAAISSIYVWVGCFVCSIWFGEDGFIISMAILFVVRPCVFWWLLVAKRNSYEV